MRGPTLLSIQMHIRRPTKTFFRNAAAGFAAAALVVSLGTTSAHATQPGTNAVTPAAQTLAEDSERGLFGSQDATFDGAFRQSLSILGLVSVDRKVPRAAIAWLIDQQCADGSFTSYRTDTSAPCPPVDLSSFTGPDTNSTALAAMALMSTDQIRPARKAVRWLIDQQGRDGGWPYLAGLESDASSTGLTLAALRKSDIPRARPAKAPARSFLTSLVAGCETDEAQRFGLGFQPGSPVDSFSSVQGLLGLAGTLPVREREQRRGGAKVTCDSEGAVDRALPAVSRWVIRQLNTNDGSIPSSFAPGETDWNSTALGILGLVSARLGGNATDGAVATLAGNIDDYIIGDGDRPAALGTTLLVTSATGNDARSFGGTDLIKRLIDTMQR